MGAAQTRAAEGDQASDRGCSWTGRFSEGDRWMSLIEKAAVKAGVEIVHDTLPQKQRTVRCFQRLIAAMRATEAEVQDRLSQSERELNEALKLNLGLQEENQRLKAKILQHEIGSIEALTTGDRNKLL